MDIIIPYQHSDANELRYTLRSICKHQPHDRVIVVGDKIDWYNGQHIEARDTPGRPEFSVVNKILIASMQVSGDFVLWQDDIFKLNNNPIKPVYCDTLKDALTKRQGGRLRNILHNTYNVFPDGYYYGGHTPMEMNMAILAEAVEKHWSKDLVPKSLYGNYAKVGGERVPDCKLRGSNRYEVIMKFIEDKDYLSLGHFSMNRDMMKVLNELFPEKCKYER